MNYNKIRLEEGDNFPRKESASEDIKENSTSTSTQNTDIQEDELKTSNEYVLNFAFFSFLLFMITESFFAIFARSESMLADAMAMSVDAFTYLFNLVAERLKHRSSTQFENLSIEEARRRKKILRLYLEFFPPMISVTALIVVSCQTLIESVETITNYELKRSEVAMDESDEPDVKIMLFFSVLNLGLDIMNVLCFTKVQNFTLLGTAKDDKSQLDIYGHKTNDEEALLISQQPDQSSNELIHDMPPSIIVDTSMDSSFNDENDTDGETDALLGIPTPNYGSHQEDNEWGENFSLAVLYGNASQADSLTSGGISVESAETGESFGSASHSQKSLRSKARDKGIGGLDDLCDISEGEEEEDVGSSTDNDLSVNQNDESDNDSESNDSERTGKGFNLNMCSAYTVSTVGFNCLLFCTLQSQSNSLVVCKNNSM